MAQLKVEPEGKRPLVKTHKKTWEMVFNPVVNGYTKTVKITGKNAEKGKKQLPTEIIKTTKTKI